MQGMDTQRLILWIIFSMSLVFLWDRWQQYQGQPSFFAPAPTQPAPGPETKAAEKRVEPQAPNGATDASVPNAATAPAASAAASSAAPASGDAIERPRERITVASDLLQLDFDPAGASLVRAELLQQKIPPDWTASGLIGLVLGKKEDHESEVVLLEVTDQRYYVAQSGVIGGEFPNHRSAWHALPGARQMAEGQDTLAITFEAEAGGARVRKTYTLRRGHYDVQVSHEIANTGAAPITPSVYLQIMRDGNKPEGQSSFYSTFTGPAFYSDKEKFQKIDFSDINKGKATHVKSAPDGWVAMIQHYFVAAWVPPPGPERDFYSTKFKDNLFIVGTKYALPAIAPGASETSIASLYIGPQDQHALEQLAPGLDLVVDYGWLTVLSKPLFWLLQFLHNGLGNWGWAIVIATLLIKLALFPLSAASYKSMARMKEVTPRMMKIREQYGDDKQKLNAAMMELYKNEKINPIGGCLPIVVQIPVFLAYYWVLLASVEMRNQPWMLWVHDLASPDPWFVLPIAMMATMIVQYKLNPTPPDPVQAKVMAIMPFIFGAMFFMFPAGLVLYWFVNNLLSIAQQAYITRNLTKAKPVG